VIEVQERIRPLKEFEKNTQQKVITGINQEQYVVETELNLKQVEEQLTRLHFE
jgi:uncharacterized coiled-coil protein SlyX